MISQFRLGKPTAPSKTKRLNVSAFGQYWLMAIALLIAIVVRAMSWLNCDVSWLLTLGERVLSGARPYIDFTEPNPPASILIYLPAILIGRLFGFAPELAVTLLIFAGV